METRFFVRQEGKFIIQAKGDKRATALARCLFFTKCLLEKAKNNTRPERTYRI